MPATIPSRRRLRAIVRSGVLATIGSEGRLVFAIAAAWADPQTCEFRMPFRATAREIGCNATALRRGVKQLLDAGVLQERPWGRRRRYRIARPPRPTSMESRW